MIGSARAQRARMAVSSARGGLATPAGRGFALIAVATAATGFAMAANQNIVSNYFEGELSICTILVVYLTVIEIQYSINHTFNLF